MITFIGDSKMADDVKFWRWCKQMCPPQKGCKHRKQATAQTTWAYLKTVCPELKKINKRLNNNLI
jgi:hypothetical protein